MTKPRSDAKLLNLPHDQQDRICGWLLDGVETEDGMDTGYKKVAEQIYMDFGVKTSIGALSEFYRKVVAPKRLRRAADAASSFVEAAAERGLGFEDSAKVLIQQKYFEIAASDRVNSGELLDFTNMISGFEKAAIKRREMALRERDMEVKERRLELLESAHAQAKVELQKLRNPQSELSDTERAAIVAKVDSILGIK